ncbi:translocation/assembly module TamB domain-containing protein [Selenihalanaerobacter shriftii]|uniref:Translocation and assembly module TamB n=1 Tax=Selenihalanaerobacter shriftii TaxID=142842 RepID=A0A1T4KZA9_9FIRM|nr:translocation/assembly module TamB domain-containing protein [Selenihalanaerobacter shriftii]SJZ47647.1 translocation and assembly module TamB [Selenihalanaerobacter shriftii]
MISVNKKVKIVLPMVLVLCLLGFVIFTLSSNWVNFSAQIKEKMVSIVKDKYGYQIDLAKIEISGINQLLIKDLYLDDGRKYQLTANKVEISYNILDVLLQKSDMISSVRQVELFSPKLEVTKVKDPDINIIPIVNHFTGKIIVKEGTLSGDIDAIKGINRLEKINGKVKLNKKSMKFNLNSRLPDNNGQFIVEGIADLREFQVSINLNDLNLNLFASELQNTLSKSKIKLKDGRVNGTLHVKGNTTVNSLADLDYNGELEIKDSILKHDDFSYGIKIVNGRLNINKQGLIIKKLIADINGSKLDLAGVVKGWQDSKLYLEFSSSHLDLNILTDLLPSQLVVDGSAKTVGQIRGSVSNPEVRTQIRLPEVEINDFKFKNFRFGLRYKNNLITLSGFKSKVANGTLSGRGTISWSKDNPLVYTASLESKGIELKRLKPISQSLDLTGKLNGSLVIGGQESFESLTMFGSIKVDSGAWREYKFDGMNSNFWFNDTQLLLSDITVKSGESRWNARGVVNTDQTLSLDITAKDVKLSELTGLHNYRTLVGSANLQGKLSGKISSPHFSGDIKGEEISYKNRELEKVKGRLTYGNERIILEDMVITDQSSNYELVGSIQLANKPKFDLNLKTKAGKIRDLYKFIISQELKEVDGQFAGGLNIKGTVDDFQAEGRLRILAGQVRGIKLSSGWLTLNWQDNKLRIENLQLFSDDSKLIGQGIVKRNGDLDITLNAEDVSISELDLFPIGFGELQGSLDFTGHLKGNLSNPNLIGDVDLNEGVVAGHDLQNITGNINYMDQIISLQNLEINRQETEYEINGDLDLEKKEFKELHLEMVDGQLAELAEILPWEVKEKIPHSFFGQLVFNGAFKEPKVKGQILVGDIDRDGYLILKGSYDYRLGADLLLQTKNFALAPFDGSIPLNHDIGGSLNSKIELDGELNSLDINSSIEILNGHVDDYEYESLAGSFILKEGNQFKITRQLKLRVNDQNLITADGYLPLRGQTDPLYIDIKFKEGDLSLLSQWLEGVKTAEGNGDAHLVISGSKRDPHYDGRVEVNNGELSIVGLTSDFSNLNGVLEIKDQLIKVDKLTSRYGGGSFNTQGNVRINDWRLGEVNLTFTGDSLPVEHGSWQGKNDATLKIGGIASNPIIRGEILAYDTRIIIPFKWPAVSDGSKSLIEPQFDLKVKPGKEVKVYNDNIDILIEEGTLQIVSGKQGIELKGELTSKTGGFNYYNTEFELVSGTATFDEYGGNIPKLDIVANTKVMNLVEEQEKEYDTEKVEVLLRLGGPANQMSINLESDPSLSKPEILNLLARRGGLGSLLEGNYDQVIEDELVRVLQAGIRVEFLSNIEETLEDKWDLDEFKLYSGIGNGFNLKMGKQITDDLFLKYNQEFAGDEERSIGFEYEMFDKLKDVVLDGTIGNDDEYRLELEAKFSFN